MIEIIVLYDHMEETVDADGEHEFKARQFWSPQLGMNIGCINGFIFELVSFSFQMTTRIYYLKL